MEYAIQIRGLRKSYGNHPVLKGLDFQVRQGEIFALLGVNGAGKTTALECMEGLRSYDSGEILVNGRVGIQLQSASLPEHIKAIEAVRLFAKWRRVPPGKSRREMPDALGIGEIAQKPYYQLSTGQKRRLHLALALIGDPDILFLDEPAAGLDVEGRAALHQEIRRLQSQGKTILLASHDMAEVESLCSRIAILSDGIIAFTGTPWELKEKVGTHYHITVRTSAGMESFTTDRVEEALPALFARCREKGTVISDLRVDRGSLEEHFLKIAKKEETK
ncbi:MAG TPA: ABC transporter ATP-binding protein [Candidatus Limivivens intestinipullorum]|uniref:ABC transporter ATP-binding protein n=1 Tax=Candidatus Limivivens intestinipullorum TaxID=2840858 RepID=A0A9D1ERF8_9FIRM|nr:ABC transporter ATP-binding protein [Candidatus Limivivens intestinipullorum]